MPFTKFHAALLRARLLAGEDAEDIASEEDVPVKEIEKLIKKDGGKPQDVAVMRSDLENPRPFIEFLFFSDGKLIFDNNEWARMQLTYGEWKGQFLDTATLEREKKMMMEGGMTVWKFKDRKLRNVMQKYSMDYTRWRESKK